MQKKYYEKVALGMKKKKKENLLGRQRLGMINKEGRERERERGKKRRLK